MRWNLKKHTKGESYKKPFILLPWQREIIHNVFGVIKEDGYRQFTTVYVEFPKKQGKTELGAAIALYMLTADGERGAEIYSCAADRAQASLIYQVAIEMIRSCPALQKRLKIIAFQKRVIYPAMNSFYQVLSSEAYSKHGINPHAVLYDELHVADREMFNVMTHGGHPVLRWMMDNIHVKTDPAGNIKPDKEKSTERIDGAVALIMALDRAIRHENKGSVYDGRGILVLWGL